MKKITIGTTSSGILGQLRDIYSICRCWWNVATYKWKFHNGKIEIISLVVKCSSFSLSISGCMSRYEADLAVSVVLFIYKLSYIVSISFKLG